MKYSFVIIALFILASCTDSSVPDARLVATYSDVIIVRESFGDSTTVRYKTDSILKAHQYDSTAFAQELRSMSNTPQLFKSFYDSVSATIGKRRAKLK